MMDPPPEKPSFPDESVEGPSGSVAESPPEPSELAEGESLAELMTQESPARAPAAGTDMTPIKKPETEREMENKPAKKAVPKNRGKGKATAQDPSQVKRRAFVWWSVFAYIAALTLASVRFFFPRVLFEPKTRFRIGFPSDYAIGVDTKWQASKRIWVVRDASRLFVILARCTHLGCTPDWKPSENKFKCPCHGSGFTSEGVNFEGPAPYPLFRLKVEKDPRGEIIVDKAVEFPFEKWEEADASLPV
ncbi:MAG: ubiquinol-cytochrome c reductase iron-sulfur subunit [Planctomycetota bacterium]